MLSGQRRPNEVTAPTSDVGARAPAGGAPSAGARRAAVPAWQTGSAAPEGSWKRLPAGSLQLLVMSTMVFVGAGIVAGLTGGQTLFGPVVGTLVTLAGGSAFVAFIVAPLVALHLVPNARARLWQRAKPVVAYLGSGFAGVLLAVVVLLVVGYATDWIPPAPR